MNRLLLTLSALIVLFASCKKEDAPTSAEEDLRSGVWRRTSGKYLYKDPDTKGDSLRNYMLTEDPCRLDNSIRFKEGYVGEINHGDNHCTAAESNKDFTWAITRDEKHISLYGVRDYFPINDVDAEILTRTLGYLTIRYKVITADAAHSTFDTLIYTDVLRR
jgi:hypothetical protein